MILQLATISKFYVHICIIYVHVIDHLLGFFVPHLCPTPELCHGSSHRGKAGRKKMLQTSHSEMQTSSNPRCKRRKLCCFFVEASLIIFVVLLTTNNLIDLQVSDVLFFMILSSIFMGI